MSRISHIIIKINQQKLYCCDDEEKVVFEYPVSTSSFGIGNQNGSFKTPLGEHSIAQKIGADCAINEVFIGRAPQGELEVLQAEGQTLPEDIITSRILWLEGREPGVNNGEGIDSHQRYIYIHGTPEEEKIGIPASHGCIRMRNRDVVDLFNHVDEGCRVLIQE